MGSSEDTSIRELELKSLGDITLRKLELQTLQSEAEWFVGSEIPTVGRKIKRILQNCLAFLSPKGAAELELLPDLVPVSDDDDVVIPDLDQSNRLAAFDVQDGALKGFITVGGWSITGAEITVRFPKWNKGIAHKASVSATHPWRLYQLQNAYNFVKMTLGELDLLMQQCETKLHQPHSTGQQPQQQTQHTSPPQSPPTPHKYPPPLTHSPSTFLPSILSITPHTTLAAVNKLVGQVSKWMALARDALMIPTKSLLFPYSLTNMGFHPALPPDLHIEFSVCNSEIIYTLSMWGLESSRCTIIPPVKDYLLQLLILLLPIGYPLTYIFLSFSLILIHLSLTLSKERGPPSPSASNSSLTPSSSNNNINNNNTNSLASSSSSLQVSSSGMKHKTPSVGNLLNLPASFSFGSEKSQSNLGKIEEDHAGERDTGGDGSAVPSISVVGTGATTAGPASPDHRISIGGGSYKTYQYSQRGAPAWVAVIDQAEVHCIIPRINHTLSLITSAIDTLADIEDKLVALSLL